MSTPPTIDEFAAEAESWLAQNATPRRVDDGASSFVWGEGEFSTAVFHSLEHGEEQRVLDDLVAWNQRKAERGYHAIAWAEEHGGLGLSRGHARAFARLERGYEQPASHELFSVTKGLIVNTINLLGTEWHKQEFIAPLLRAEILCCQLFSEPGAGSDLAGLGCRAERDGDEWVLNGQKVWSSGAQFADWGMLIARSNPDVVKHKGMTAFMVPLDAPGVEVRPIKQMSGGSSFNEVFLNDARVADDLRLGAEGEGWKVALTALGFERDHSDSGGSGQSIGGSVDQLFATARHVDSVGDPVVREALVEMYVHRRAEHMLNRRAADLARSGTPGPEGSLGKIFWTEGMTAMSEAVSAVLGPRLVTDTGEWGTYEWGEHVLGAPGYRIAGGSDEIQRNIIGERVLGLPGEPRVDREQAWRDVPR